MNPLDLLKPVAYPSAFPELPFEVHYGLSAELSFSWNGEVLAGKGRSREEIIHEACHFWVASKGQREAVEFGLGPNKATPPKFKAYVKKYMCVSKKEAWRQEEEASMLQLIVMRYQGQEVKPTLDAHGWLDMVEVEYNRKAALKEFKKIAEKVLKRLLKKKLINTKLEPLL